MRDELHRPRGDGGIGRPQPPLARRVLDQRPEAGRAGHLERLGRRIASGVARPGPQHDLGRRPRNHALAIGGQLHRGDGTGLDRERSFSRKFRRLGQGRAQPRASGGARWQGPGRPRFSWRALLRRRHPATAGSQDQTRLRQRLAGVVGCQDADAHLLHAVGPDTLLQQDEVQPGNLRDGQRNALGAVPHFVDARWNHHRHLRLSMRVRLRRPEAPLPDLDRDAGAGPRVHQRDAASPEREHGPRQLPGDHRGEERELGKHLGRWDVVGGPRFRSLAPEVDDDSGACRKPRLGGRGDVQDGADGFVAQLQVGRVGLDVKRSGERRGRQEDRERKGHGPLAAQTGASRHSNEAVKGAATEQVWHFRRRQAERNGRVGGQ